jgi:hypothetical protein
MSDDSPGGLTILVEIASTIGNGASGGLGRLAGYVA